MEASDRSRSRMGRAVSAARSPELARLEVRDGQPRFVTVAPATENCSKEWSTVLRRRRPIEPQIRIVLDGGAPRVIATGVSRRQLQQLRNVAGATRQRKFRVGGHSAVRRAIEPFLRGSSRSARFWRLMYRVDRESLGSRLCNACLSRPLRCACAGRRGGAGELGLHRLGHESEAAPARCQLARASGVACSRRGPR